jgi:uncharacterized protein YecE (DUF72 family)
MEIRIGTSGYSFEDWKGSFYPVNIQKGKMLDYYVNYFNTVEINSTYYRIPHPAVMANIDKKTPKNFEFIVKTPQAMTHLRKDVEKTIQEFATCLRPMEDSGKLKGLLAQFPYSFKFSAASLDYIKYCQELLKPRQIFVEFRHAGWNNQEMIESFIRKEVGYVSVDEPQLPGLLKPELIQTTDIAYLRLHGRNSEHWWNGGPLRYDYSYSQKELQEWKERINKAEEKTKKLFIFFNNCHLGQAVKNARQMMQRLNI